MNRRVVPFPLAARPVCGALLATCLVWITGCGGEDAAIPPPAAPGSAGAGAVVSESGQVFAVEPRTEDERKAILNSSLRLIQDASSNPGGTNFDQATEQLNQYFLGTPPRSFALTDASRSYLKNRLGPNAEQALKDLENPQFTVRDARHIEDSLLAYTLAMRVAGDGDDLTRVRRIFDWIVRNVELVPAGSLGSGSMPQAQARPFDVLLRGMATEQGDWAERAWLFMTLCRQLDIDSGLLFYQARPRSLLEQAPGGEPAADAEAAPRVWCCVAIVEGKPYLFDARIGLPIPGPDGKGIATADQAVADRSILESLELPGIASYPNRYADIASAGKLRIMVDSTLGRLTPRMRELQKNLTGRNRMVLYRDPSEQAIAFQKAFGPLFGGTVLWTLPMEVEYRLFNDPQFVEATQYPIKIFDARFPLLPTRMLQLQGQLKDSVERYVAFRKQNDNVERDGKTPITPEIQSVLDIYATYFLALAKLDEGNTKNAADLFVQTLEMLPEPGRGRPFWNMFRWGAETNLAKIYEANGQTARAIRYYTLPQPTPQFHGNLLRARDLVWKHPFTPGPTPPVVSPPAGELGEPSDAQAAAPASVGP